MHPLPPRTPHPDDWSPHPPQARFLALGCFEALYGGAAGGGKSDALLVAAAQGVGQGYGRAYAALLLRRTFPELELSLVRRSHELYPRLGARYKADTRTWHFPAGETIAFGHCEREAEVTRYQGAAFQFVGFDELTTFTEYQYLYLFSRTRSAACVPCRVRAASNPGGLGHAWVRKRWLPWVSRKADRPERAGIRRWYLRRGDAEQEVPAGTTDALARTFIPARLDDNPTLAQGDPNYRARLLSLPRVERLRLLGGDWDAAPAKRDYWDRDRIQVLRVCPPRPEVQRRARAWDFAASDDPTADWSVGARCSYTHAGLFVVEHLARFQGGPDLLYARFGEQGDADLAFDPSTTQRIPEDPGAAGKLVVADFCARFPQLSIKARRPSGDKPTRFLPVSSRALSGRVALVDDGSWDVDALHEELEGLWDSAHDDQADALSDAYAEAAMDAPYAFTRVPSARATAPRRR